jgi:serine/threonine-protein kinase
MPQAGDVFGRFVLQRELGRGPMSEVFLAEDDSRWKVAVKFFLLEPGSSMDDRPKWSTRMVREARAAADFRHPNVVAIHEVGDVAGFPFLIRDFIEGRSLAEMAFDRDPGLAAWRVHWVRELARTLADIHRAGLVHRDVKSSNALVRRDGALRVLDFGVARRSVDRTAGLAAPISERIPSIPKPRVIGTPAYTAPERFASQPASPAADQFGWGVVAYEVLTGWLPWGGERDGPVKMIEAMLTQAPAPLRSLAPEVPTGIEHVIARALAKAPRDRFPGMDDVVRALDAACAPRAF